ncbi:MAG: DUF2851 family protein [Ktedonobacterales bacterium]
MHEASVHRREAELAARWAAGAWVGQMLHTERGDTYSVTYQGRRGGGAGPDFRDAVLTRADGSRVYGDVELHLRAASWHAHGHDGDPRYDGVVLHVVLTPLGIHQERETLLANGDRTPIAVLRTEGHTGQPVAWPCASLGQRAGAAQVRALLHEAGVQRFALRADSYHRELAHVALRAEQAMRSSALWTPTDRVLWVALAEALAYGRDREALRYLGERLAAGVPSTILAAESALLPEVERTRIRGLLELRERWLHSGPWEPLRHCIAHHAPIAAVKALVEAVSVAGGSVSRGRALIVLANVVLPFAAAWATLEGHLLLVEQAREVFTALPGLPSNQITRLMARQIGMSRLPSGAVAQIGLHHLWAEQCRHKHCERCPCALR